MGIARSLALLLVYSSLLLCLPRSDDAASIPDELALLSFKSSLMSEGNSLLLSSWNASGRHCTWPGVVCGRHLERVVALWLGSFNLSGIISPSLGKLSFLRELDLSGNYLSGDIPTELGRLGRLRWLDLSNNQLQGMIPHEIGAGLKHLSYLNLGTNGFSGEIPSALGNLTNLQILNLDSNRLSGAIPSSLGQLCSLSFLSFATNNLTGVIPNSIWNLTSLRVFTAGENMLGGMIPNEIGAGLKHLSYLDLVTNGFSGEIPSALGNLTNLQILNLGYNRLSGAIPSSLGQLCSLSFLSFATNSLTGVIPNSIWNLTSLRVFAARKNMLGGMIPHEIGASLKHLSYLDLGTNGLSGEILPTLGNLTNLHELYLGYNRLSGAIPSSLGQLRSLSKLSLDSNNLTGVIPNCIWNLTSLRLFSVRVNMLGGMMPSNAFSALHLLKVTYMDTNHFHGKFPASLANASHVSELQISDNFFSGIFPSGFGRLRNLTFLLLGMNLFQAGEPKDWAFITELTNCSQLLSLELSNNKLAGVLPSSFSNLSTSLNFLTLGTNKITGSIPKDIGNLIGLQHLYLYENYFTGSLPSSVGRLKNLALLYAYNNRLNGSIPLAIGNLTELTNLLLGTNKFCGWIPDTLSNLTKLLELGLSRNNLSGPIPSGLFNIQTLSIMINVSNNNLEGSIPQEIGHLKNLEEFRAESNRFSGEIPSTLGECQVLRYLYLQNNFLTGSIPSALGQLKGLETLDLSSNNLSGQIPTSLADITMLHSLNLSFNSFVGEVPAVGAFADATRISIQGNAKLCGGILDLHLPPCYPLQQSRKHFPVVRISISLIAALAILSSLYMLISWHKRSTKGALLTTSMKGHPSVSYLQLAKATDGFSPTNLLGSGSFGSVYKGNLDNQDGGSTDLVAVKVLKLENPKAPKSFSAECEALRNMRHRNLVKIVTICSSIDNRGNDFKAIVYDFLPNGSLEDWLHPSTNNQAEKRHLNLHQRVTILLDVACALDYLHCHGPETVVHCDIKSSNVLLDGDMVAHVGDFGLARILVEGSSLMQQSTSSTGFRGTIGYAAPEYGVGNIASTHGDIYSYGILVLETVTGKRPTDVIFRPGLSLRQYVEPGLHGIVMDVVDTNLLSDSENCLQTTNDSPCKRITGCLVSLLRLGLSCSQELPSSRTPTGDIINELNAIKQNISRLYPACEDGRHEF